MIPARPCKYYCFSWVAVFVLLCHFCGHAQNLNGVRIQVAPDALTYLKFNGDIKRFEFGGDHDDYTGQVVENDQLRIKTLNADPRPTNLAVTEGGRTHIFIIQVMKKIDINNFKAYYDFSDLKALRKLAASGAAEPALAGATATKEADKKDNTANANAEDRPSKKQQREAEKARKEAERAQKEKEQQEAVAKKQQEDQERQERDAAAQALKDKAAAKERELAAAKEQERLKQEAMVKAKEAAAEQKRLKAEQAQREREAAAAKAREQQLQKERQKEEALARQREAQEAKQRADEEKAAQAREAKRQQEIAAAQEKDRKAAIAKAEAQRKQEEADRTAAEKARKAAADKEAALAREKEQKRQAELDRAAAAAQERLKQEELTRRKQEALEQERLRREAAIRQQQLALEQEQQRRKEEAAANEARAAERAKKAQADKELAAAKARERADAMIKNPYWKSEWHKKYPQVNFAEGPVGQLYAGEYFLPKDTLYNHDAAQELLMTRALLKKTYEESGEGVRVRLEHIAFKGVNSYFRIHVFNNSNKDFLVGKMQLTWWKKAGGGYFLNPVYVTDFPVVPPGTDVTLVFACHGVNAKDEDDFGFKLSDRLTGRETEILFPGNLYNKQMNLDK